MRLFKDKRGQSQITIFFWLLTFYILFFLFLGGWLNTWGHNTVTLNSLTGFEAFFFDNIVMVPILVSIIFVLAYSYIGGSR